MNNRTKQNVAVDRNTFCFDVEFIIDSPVIKSPFERVQIGQRRSALFIEPRGNFTLLQKNQCYALLLKSSSFSKQWPRRLYRKASRQKRKSAANAIALLTLMLIPCARVAPTWPVPTSNVHLASGYRETLTA